MEQNEQMEILLKAVKEFGQAEVARRISYHSSTLSQLLSGTYGGDPSRVLECVEAEFGNSMVECPVLGETPLATCLEKRRRKKFLPTNSRSARLFRACKTCEQNHVRSQKEGDQ